MAVMIEGTKVVLRALTEQDMQKIQQWENDNEIGSLMGKDPTTHLAHLDWYERMLHGKRSKFLAIQTKTGRLIGDIGLAEICWRRQEAELAVVRIGEKRYWDRGYGMDAIRTMLAFGFGELRLKRVYLRVLRDNVRAIRCYEKCGFKRQGVLRRRVGSSPESTKEILFMVVSREDFSIGRDWRAPLAAGCAD